MIPVSIPQRDFCVLSCQGQTVNPHGIPSLLLSHHIKSSQPIVSHGIVQICTLNGFTGYFLLGQGKSYQKDIIPWGVTTAVAHIPKLWTKHWHNSHIAIFTLHKFCDILFLVFVSSLHLSWRPKPLTNVPNATLSVFSSVFLYWFFFSFHLQFWCCWGWWVHDSHFHSSFFFVVLLQFNQIALSWIISSFLLHLWIFCRGTSISKPSSIQNATEKGNVPTSSENTFFFLINPSAPHCFAACNCHQWKCICLAVKGEKTQIFLCSQLSVCQVPAAPFGVWALQRHFLLFWAVLCLPCVCVIRNSLSSPGKQWVFP